MKVTPEMEVVATCVGVTVTFTLDEAATLCALIDSYSKYGFAMKEEAFVKDIGSLRRGQATQGELRASLRKALDLIK